MTIKGVHIFIKDNETFSEAMTRFKAEHKDSVKTSVVMAKKTAKSTEEETGSNTAKPVTSGGEKTDGVKNCKAKEEGEEFRERLEAAKNTQPNERAWRVDTDSHQGEDYIGMKTFVSEKGSTFAVTKDGDIISVCKFSGDDISGSELLSKAVKAGGNKLDSFDGNFAFYLKNGFEPVSWTAFDERYKPDGWVKGRNRPEPVVFFKYTGNKQKNKSDMYYEIQKNLFYSKVKMSSDYDTAMSIRDKSINKK